jgi:hypothetical protein
MAKYGLEVFKSGSNETQFSTEQKGYSVIKHGTATAVQWQGDKRYMPFTDLKVFAQTEQNIFDGLTSYEPEIRVVDEGPNYEVTIDAGPVNIVSSIAKAWGERIGTYLDPVTATIIPITYYETYTIGGLIENIFNECTHTDLEFLVHIVSSSSNVSYFEELAEYLILATALCGKTRIEEWDFVIGELRDSITACYNQGDPDAEIIYYVSAGWQVYSNIAMSSYLGDIAYFYRSEWTLSEVLSEFDSMCRIIHLFTYDYYYGIGERNGRIISRGRDAAGDLARTFLSTHPHSTGSDYMNKVWYQKRLKMYGYSTIHSNFLIRWGTRYDSSRRIYYLMQDNKTLIEWFVMFLDENRSTLYDELIADGYAVRLDYFKEYHNGDNPFRYAILGR